MLVAASIVGGTTLRVGSEPVRAPDVAAEEATASFALSLSSKQPLGKYEDCSASPDFVENYWHNWTLREAWRFGAALLKDSQRMTIACIGDSTTHGLNVARGEEYPAVLHRLFSKQLNVINLGVTASSARHEGNYSYWASPQWAIAAKTRIDIAIVMLGINDAAGKSWNKTEYVQDYLDMVQEILRVHPNATMFVAMPPPCLTCKRFSRQQLAEAVASVWRKAKLETAPINFYDAFAVRQKWGYHMDEFYFEDGVHPAGRGYNLMAQVAHAALSSGMVSPRGFCSRCQASDYQDLCEKFCSAAPAAPPAASRSRPPPGRGHGRRHGRQEAMKAAEAKRAKEAMNTEDGHAATTTTATTPDHVWPQVGLE